MFKGLTPFIAPPTPTQLLLSQNWDETWPVRPACKVHGAQPVRLLLEGGRVIALFVHSVVLLVLL